MSFPTGLISLWFGSIASIPPGWVLCDGNNGTPDLRNLFTVGAGDTYAVGQTGGNANHSHNVSTVGHAHALPSGTSFGAGTEYDDITTTVAPSGTTNTKNNRPPFMALAYIMKT